MCPTCNSEDSKVLETRKYLGSVYRRRKCRGCGGAYVTEERPAKSNRMPQEIIDAGFARLHAKHQP